jgi:membrane protease YdiL (CAAX protease family)
LLPPVSVILAFGALTLSFTLLWLAPAPAGEGRAPYWTLAFASALAAALAGGIVDVRGLIVLLAFAAACRAAGRAERPVTRVAAHLVMLLTCGGLMLHVMPGFNNPVVIGEVVISPGGVPYTKYVNFDKAVAGLFLLGLYAPDLIARGNAPASIREFTWRFGVLVAVVVALSLAFGFVRWDPKMPAWFPVWAWSMLFLTVLPEEALFRGVIQTSLERRLGGSRRATICAILIAGLLFGLAHAGGGTTYVVLATLAGVGYGWISAALRSLGAAIAAHFCLNVIHFLFFTYPALALPV